MVATPALYHQIVGERSLADAVTLGILRPYRSVVPLERSRLKVLIWL
jgi:hypothetical protein